MVVATTKTTGATNSEFDTTSYSLSDKFKELDPKSFLQGFFAQSTRPDGRLFSMCRPTQITQGILRKHTVGSSLVRLGNTQVLCGVTLQIGVPSIPNQGDIAVSPPELEHILMDTVDLSCLSIIDGQAAWRLQVTLQVLEDYGNVWDASLLAAVAALKDTRLPTTIRNASSGQLEILQDDAEKGSVIDFLCLPVPLTVGIYYNDPNVHLLADPTQEEAILFEGYLTLVVNEEKEIVYTQHASTIGLSQQDMAVGAHMAYGRAKEIQDLLE